MRHNQPKEAGVELALPLPRQWFPCNDSATVETIVRGAHAWMPR